MDIPMAGTWKTLYAPLVICDANLMWRVGAFLLLAWTNLSTNNLAAHVTSRQWTKWYISATENTYLIMLVKSFVKHTVHDKTTYIPLQWVDMHWNVIWLFYYDLLCTETLFYSPAMVWYALQCCIILTHYFGDFALLSAWEARGVCVT